MGLCGWPLCSRGAESADTVQEEYKLSKEEFISFTSASKSTSSSKKEQKREKGDNLGHDVNADCKYINN